MSTQDLFILQSSLSWITKQGLFQPLKELISGEISNPQIR